MRRALRDLFTCFGASDSDFDAAEIIVGELLGNTVRYAPGQITIRLEWSGEEAVFTIHDRGSGFIPDPDLPDEMGTGGRGLYIVKKLARALTITHSRHGGSQVTATLPIRRPDDTPESPATV